MSSSVHIWNPKIEMGTRAVDPTGNRSKFGIGDDVIVYGDRCIIKSIYSTDRGFRYEVVKSEDYGDRNSFRSNGKYEDVIFPEVKLYTRS